MTGEKFAVDGLFEIIGLVYRQSCRFCTLLYGAGQGFLAASRRAVRLAVNGDNVVAAVVY